MYPRVSTYMSRNVYTISPDDNLEKARNMMLSNMVGRLVVVNNDRRPVGVITASDIAEALFYKFSSRTLTSIKVRDVMSRNPITITPMKTVKAAATLMVKHGVGGLPVVNSEGRLVGIITRTGLLRAFRDKFRGIATVGSLMRTSFAKVQRSHGLLHVARLLDLDAAGKVLVFDGEKLVGVITKSDIILLGWELKSARKVLRTHRMKTISIGPVAPRHILTLAIAEDVMTPKPVTIKPEVDAADAADIMLSRNIGALPVVDDNERVLGVFTKLEVLEALSRGIGR